MFLLSSFPSTNQKNGERKEKKDARLISYSGDCQLELLSTSRWPEGLLRPLVSLLGRCEVNAQGNRLWRVELEKIVWLFGSKSPWSLGTKVTLLINHLRMERRHGEGRADLFCARLHGAYSHSSPRWVIFFLPLLLFLFFFLVPSLFSPFFFFSFNHGETVVQRV